jgi:hypothetical protein
MKKTLITFMLAITLPCIVFALPVASKAIIKVKNSATSNGVLTFTFKPKGGNSKKIEVKIKNGWTALRVAREIAIKLKSEMPTQYRATSRSHGYVNCVDVEKDMMKYADFTLNYLGSDVDGLSIEVEENNN